MTTKYSKAEQEDARQWLLEKLKPGDTITTILRHVSRSGMYRAIDLYIYKDNEPVWLSGMAAKLLEGFDDKRDACKASGCGMDMGFHLVYNLSAQLFHEYECIGENCPSNYHVNYYSLGQPKEQLHHSDDYALRQRWQ